MSETKPGKKEEKERRPERLPFGPRFIEKTMLDLYRAIEEKGLESTEEINAYLKELTDSGQKAEPRKPRTPLEEAQDLMYEAWETRSRKKRIEMARRALQISPDCADAYVLLAEETAKNLQEERDLYAQGVQAGERALGAEFFQECAGGFWGIIETRPYMRARLGLAEVLWELGERKEAINHYTELLRLNPNDNQGVRYLLLPALMEEGDDRAARKLWQQYKEEASTDWLYTGALLAFREKGETARANRLLRQAIEANRFVFALMLNLKKIPTTSSPYLRLGSPEEAMEYVFHNAELWVKTEGTLEWVAKQLLTMFLLEKPLKEPLFKE